MIATAACLAACLKKLDELSGNLDAPGMEVFWKLVEELVGSLEVVRRFKSDLVRLDRKKD